MTRDVWVFLFLSLLSFLISRHSIIIAVAVAVPTSITSSPYSSQRPSPASECDALLQFSQSFTISRDASAYYCDDRLLANTSYPKTASWKNGTNCCSWDGVTCHMSKDYVIGLDLSCSWLQGALHSNNTLFSLQNLQRLNLADMSRISPNSLTNLSSTLTSLRLDGCRLQGTFPINIFHLPNLRILSLSYNSNLTGALPQTNWSSSPLVRLSLFYTKFHGPIPDSVGNLTSLEYLDLAGSEFSGSVPPTLGNLDRLSSLYLSGINLSGTVDFDMFARLKNLEELYLARNLNVMLPNDGNCSFPRLKDLSLYGVNLTEFPYFLSSSRELESLDLSGNKISGPIPEWFGRVWSNTLTNLDLYSNNFTGEIPSSICQLSSLRGLFLFDNRLNGTIPRCLGNLSNLSDNHLEGLIPQGRQFDTFNHPFDWNPRLCGYPLPKACGIVEQQLPPSTSPKDGEEKAQFEHWIEWWVVAMGYGCGISFGISSGYIMLEARRPKWLVRKVERWLVRMVERKRRKKTTRSKKNAARRNHARYLFMTDFAH
ncbi:hypothetical protein CRG98_037840 [Punica granatum]|uniref:Uncharacterized protein n=1 Tax=Punica granatum TaxID=22663 RepID=A0A2I0ICQ8_PUNGR|nr:hypothetical protein CRG98_037840 [Punica granatum]